MATFTWPFNGGYSNPFRADSWQDPAPAPRPGNPFAYPPNVPREPAANVPIEPMANQGLGGPFGGAPTGRKQPHPFPRAGSPHASGEKRRHCAQCFGQVGPEGGIKADGKLYHRECFACGTCRQLIEGEYFSGEGSIFCKRCHENKLPRCNCCGKKIKGRYLTVGDRKFHAECFRCTHCRNEIQGKWYPDEDNGFVCGKCHKIFHPPKICFGCGEEIEGKYFEIGGNFFHGECFKCSSCKSTIEGSFMPTEDGKGQLCKRCQPRCDVCSGSLSGEKFLRVDGRRIHERCFTCNECGMNICGGHYKSDAGLYRCAECHGRAWKLQEDRAAAREVAQEERLKRRNSMEFLLEWRPELVPDSRLALQAMGVPEPALPRSQYVCICCDQKSGRVSCASAPRSAPGAVVNVSYLAVALRVLRNHGREPQFSLDPKDSHDIAGSYQVKKFYPDWLGGTVVGEVLFQADYVLKELSFGDRVVPALPVAYTDLGESGGEEVACRQWFVVRQAGVTLAADGAIIPHCAMGVQARRMVLGGDGYKDAPYTDPNDPMARWSEVITKNFSAVAAQLPAVAELVELAKATIVARYLLEVGCRDNPAILEQFPMPRCPEGGKYAMEIPTLRKHRKSSRVSETETGQLSLLTQQRSMYGGVDLGVPTKKVPWRAVPQRVLDVAERQAVLPLFVPRMAAAAA